MEKMAEKGISKVIVCEMNYGMIIKEVQRFRHLFKVSSIAVPTTIPFSPKYLYTRLKEEV